MQGKNAMLKVKFPEQPIKGGKEWKSHMRYVLNILRHMGADITFIPKPKAEGNKRGHSVMYINNLRVIIDYGDHLVTKYMKYEDKSWWDNAIKFHYTERHTSTPIISFPPISFYNWNQYYRLAKKTRYDPINNDRIIYRQTAHHAARKRRKKVTKLVQPFKKAAIGIIPQREFWRDVGRCLVAVFVPGARNDMLDRGHHQYIAFGCCCIHPPITNILPYGKTLVPYIHYVPCSPNYNDIPKQIRWCNKHRQECLKIGQNAKKLFLETNTPKALKGWLYKCLDL
jgi:hypothetical protein